MPCAGLWIQFQIYEFEQPLGLLSAALQVWLRIMRDIRSFYQVRMQGGQNDSHMGGGDFVAAVMIYSLNTRVHYRYHPRTIERGLTSCMPRIVSDIIAPVHLRLLYSVPKTSAGRRLQQTACGFVTRTIRKPRRCWHTDRVRQFSFNLWCCLVFVQTWTSGLLIIQYTLHVPVCVHVLFCSPLRTRTNTGAQQVTFKTVRCINYRTNSGRMTFSACSRCPSAFPTDPPISLPKPARNLQAHRVCQVLPARCNN